MQQELTDKVERMMKRFDEVEEALGKPDAFENQKLYKELTQEHSYLSSVKVVWTELSSLTQQLADNKEMLAAESDPEFTTVLKEDISKIEAALPDLQMKLENLLVPPDPNDSRNTIVELRAGTGGDEAALFVGDCVRMYRLFADKMGWKVETISGTDSEAGGYKEIVMAFSGANVHRLMQYEGGTHRVQRVPETETQGRVHTSAITVAILMEPDEDEEIELDSKDLRVDTYRASGSGGQHVNTTDSAVRVTHIPTGLVAYSMQEKSQHKNKAHAMRLLQAKIVEAERAKKAKEVSDARSSQVGSGDRSERIRTYNFPQNRITDHRINLTLYSLDKAIDGDLAELTGALVKHFYSEKLAS